MKTIPLRQAQAVQKAKKEYQPLTKPETMKPELLPLMRPAPEPLTFPKQSLLGLKTAVNAIHETVQAPYAMCANAVLAAVCLAVQGHADKRLA